MLLKCFSPIGNVFQAGCWMFNVRVRQKAKDLNTSVFFPSFPKGGRISRVHGNMYLVKLGVYLYKLYLPLGSHTICFGLFFLVKLCGISWHTTFGSHLIWFLYLVLLQQLLPVSSLLTWKNNVPNTMAFLVLLHHRIWICHGIFKFASTMFIVSNSHLLLDFIGLVAVHKEDLFCN